MEGFTRPPRAEHPYPNKPDLNKFWGTPSASGFFKSLAGFLAINAVILGGNFYITRNEKGPLGYDVTLTGEEMKKVEEITRAKSIVRRLDLPIANKSDQVLADRDIRFDDGVEFRPDNLNM